eukprot:CAMPEP_0194258708 /NCGR_PEP_ID=MMETSP0158-20130606/41878_1 /TAXON_ID=33649 /ORGANISM="Thalassionema nitzschioides, Strain L26-B" /LENGTH=418 /DNA_ID=CAMNT_0038998215 /DNA_START=13 /DNA_END=1266 /DNA_ORIENTATION=+
MAVLLIIPCLIVLQVIQNGKVVKNLAYHENSVEESNKGPESAAPDDIPPMGMHLVEHILWVLPPDGNILVLGLGNGPSFWQKQTSGRVVFLIDNNNFAGRPTHLNLEAYPVHYDNKSKQAGGSHNASIAHLITIDRLHAGERNATRDNKTHPEEIYNASMKNIIDYLDGTLNPTRHLPANISDDRWDVIVVNAQDSTDHTWYHNLLIAKNLANSQAKKLDAVTHIFINTYEKEEEKQIFTHKAFGKKPRNVLKWERGESDQTLGQAHYRALPAGIADNDWILLLTISSGFLDIFANFWAHLQTLNETRLLRPVLVAEDLPTLQHLRKKLPRNMEIRGGLALRNINDKIDQGGLAYKSKEYLNLVSRRATYIRNELDGASKVLYSDIDAVLLKDPLSFLNNTDKCNFWGILDAPMTYCT